MNLLSLQALQTDFPCSIVVDVFPLRPLNTQTIMETTSENKRSASFVCNRKELYAALSSVKMQKTAKLTFKTKFNEQKIMLVTSRFELPITCMDCKGQDTSFALLLSDMKAYCKIVPDETIRFTLEGDTLQINTTILRV